MNKHLQTKKIPNDEIKFLIVINPDYDEVKALASLYEQKHSGTIREDVKLKNKVPESNISRKNKQDKIKNVIVDKLAQRLMQHLDEIETLVRKVSFVIIAHGKRDMKLQSQNRKYTHYLGKYIKDVTLIEILSELVHKLDNKLNDSTSSKNCDKILNKFT